MSEINNRNIIIFGRFLTSYGYYLVIPFLAIYLTKYSNMTIVQVGILLALFNFGRRGFGLIAGYLSDHYGPKKVLLMGIVLEVIAYFLYTIRGGFVFFVGVVTLGGVGGCLYNIGSRSILANSREEGNIAESFSLYYIIMHMGAIFGPLTYSWLSEKGDMRTAFYIAAISYTVFFIVSALTLRDHEAEKRSTINCNDVIRAFANKKFLVYCTILTFIWFIVTQLYCGIPLYAVSKKMSDTTVANLNLINAIIVICLLFPIGKYAGRVNSLRKLDLLNIGTLTMSIGWLFCVVPIDSELGIFVAVMIFTIGEVMFMSVVDVLANVFAPNGQSGIYLGIAALTWGIGGSAGNFLGGIGFNFFIHNNINLFWLIITVIGFGTFLFCLLVRTVLFGKKATQEPNFTAGEIG
jgi:DHA1 family multidrug resistance protein-like MFS transporter